MFYQCHQLQLLGNDEIFLSLLFGHAIKSINRFFPSKLTFLYLFQLFYWLMKMENKIISSAEGGSLSLIKTEEMFFICNVYQTWLIGAVFPSRCTAWKHKMCFFSTTPRGRQGQQAHKRDTWEKQHHKFSHHSEGCWWLRMKTYSYAVILVLS